MQQKDLQSLRKALIKKAKKGVSIAFGENEIHAIKAVKVCEDLDAIFNLLSEHLREWYGTHFPELDNLSKDPQSYLKLVHSLGNRKNFAENKVLEIINDKERAKKIALAALASMGSEPSAEKLDEMRLLALNALNIREEKNFLEKFLEKEMQRIAPNFSTIAGHVLAAKFLAHSGTLKSLALMPAGTIQLIGAEKALFRHLKNKKKNRPPKHGILFSHALVRQLPAKKKGKMARTLAAKLSIAAKADFFGKRDIAAELKKETEQRAQELAKQP